MGAVSVEWDETNDPHWQLVHDGAHVAISLYTNETATDGKCDGDGCASMDDPVARRMGQFPPRDGRDAYYIGKDSYDILRLDGNRLVRNEKIFWAYKLDPHPTVELYLQRRADTTEDRDMVRVLSATASGVQFHVPVQGAGGGAGPVQRMWSSDGTYFTQQQDDGNFVSYAVDVPFDIGANPRALWSAWTGKIG